MAPLPPDYISRVYAGVLGKLIGVYLGRPFENWTYQQILEKLGPIDYYVHDKFNLPCVVIDDDVSGTFTFIRALEEHGLDITSENIGKTWLNNVIEKRNVFWWGGNGISTEHTAYLNLKKGIAAPDSGSILTNGKTVAEQIGAQIFIDGWAMVAPGNPTLAAHLAEAAARVSHDGESVHAAVLWAVMESEAFISRDVDHLIDTALSFIPKDSAIARLIADIRAWVPEDDDWEQTRQRIEDRYGYDKYKGICHVIPNHGIMIMALLYADHDFARAMRIINTSGWDTDCNSGNLGCLVGIMLGLDALSCKAQPWEKDRRGGLDWRGPISDRALISSADGGYSINTATQISIDIAQQGARLAGMPLFSFPEEQFHFSLNGVQGFQLRELPAPSNAHLKFADPLGEGQGPIVVIDTAHPYDELVDLSTDTFTPKDVLNVSRHYELSASPLLYPGQQLSSTVSVEGGGSTAKVRLRLKAYDENNMLEILDGEVITLPPGEKAVLRWVVPSSLQNKPIQQVGIAVSRDKCTGPCAVQLHSLGWTGTPSMTLRRPVAGRQELQGTEHAGASSFWQSSWVSSVDKFHTQMGPSFYIAHDRGEGMISHGTREWKDYTVVAHEFTVNLGAPAGVAVRVRGLNRWYALMFMRDGKIALIKARDEKRIELATASFNWAIDTKYEVSIEVHGSEIKAAVGEHRLSAMDSDYTSGGIGLVITNGSLSTDSIDIGPSTP